MAKTRAKKKVKKQTKKPRPPEEEKPLISREDVRSIMSTLTLVTGVARTTMMQSTIMVHELIVGRIRTIDFQRMLGLAEMSIGVLLTIKSKMLAQLPDLMRAAVKPAAKKKQR